jgi:hypothetical protein
LHASVCRQITQETVSQLETRKETIIMGWMLTLVAMARRKEAENRRKQRIKAKAQQQAKTVKKPAVDNLEVWHQQERERRGW